MLCHCPSVGLEVCTNRLVDVRKRICIQRVLPAQPKDYATVIAAVQAVMQSASPSDELAVEQIASAKREAAGIVRLWLARFAA
jgi:hypothetical protein